jgi:iron(III) transport system ATP-binding protein
MALLDVCDIRQAYDSRPVLAALSFKLEAGEIGCLLGPSGCGKTTVLRCIAGFEPISSGEIKLHGEAMSRRGLIVPAERRRIGMVFQDYALFPHLTVERNVGFGLHAFTQRARDARIAELLEQVELPHLAKRYPHELSGGQQQRVALARALAPRPELLLLDEPFSNLDVDMREQLSVEVRNVLKQQKTTAILVTHDQHEAFNIADQVGIMLQGRIEQWDTPYRLYHQPRTRFVADFVGQGVFLPGTVVDGHRIRVELGTLESHPQELLEHGAAVDVLLRPDDILHDDSSPLQARVLHKAFRGAEFLYTLELAGGGRVLSLVPSHHNHALGETIGIRLEIDHVVAFRRSPH